MQLLLHNFWLSKETHEKAQRQSKQLGIQQQSPDIWKGTAVPIKASKNNDKVYSSYLDAPSIIFIDEIDLGRG